MKQGTVVYFSGCAAKLSDPDVGQSTVLVLEKNGFSVDHPEQKCCGMPMLRLGDLKAMLKRASFNVSSLAKTENDIVTTCPTCTLTLKHFYPKLLGTAESERVAKRIYDIAEYLNILRTRGHLDTDFARVSTSLLYHAPCHLKALSPDLVGYRIKLLSEIQGASVIKLETACCGFAGSFGVLKRNRRFSMQVGADLFETIKQASDCQVVTDCPGCKLQISHCANVPVIHPVQMLRQAYRL
jgi:glycerol-3-phosphate dehydrogenase subunit C